VPCLVPGPSASRSRDPSIPSQSGGDSELKQQLEEARRGKREALEDALAAREQVALMVERQLQLSEQAEPVQQVFPSTHPNKLPGKSPQEIAAALASSLHLQQITADLSHTQQELATARQETAQLHLDLAESQSRRADTTATERKLQVELAALKAKDPESRWKQEAEQVFRAADTNSNGVLSNREINKFLKGNAPLMQRISLGVPFKWRSFLDELAGFDQNRDGQIQSGEWIRFWVSQCHAAEKSHKNSKMVATESRLATEAQRAEESEAEVRLLRADLSSVEARHKEALATVREGHMQEIRALEEQGSRHEADRGLLPYMDRALEEQGGNGRSPFPKSPPHHSPGADANSRAALQAVADANSRLQGQVATLTEQRETISEGLRMVQDELDAEHAMRRGLEREVAELREESQFGGGAAHALEASRAIEQERDDVLEEFERLSQEHEELEERYRTAVHEQESLQQRNELLANALGPHAGLR